MKMKLKNLFFMSTAVIMALTACNNNDDVMVNDPDNAVIIDGEKTYAVFKIQAGEGGNSGTRTVTPVDGEEAGIHNEATVKTAGLYIFKWNTETTGEPEVMQDNLTAIRKASGDWDIPATALMLTSGKKHVIVVANMTDAIKGQLSTAFANKSAGYEEFYTLVANLGLQGTSDNFDISTLFSEEDTKDSPAPYIIMSGEADRVLNAGVSQTEAEMTSNNNHVTVYVNRLPAKIDVRLASSADQSVVTELPVPEIGATQVGTAKNFVYDVRNQSRQVYVMKHITGSFVNTIWSDPGTTVDASRYFPIVSESLAFPSMLLSDADWNAQRAGDDYRKYVTYITENTNETALRGNTSYVALKASYVPADGCYVSGYYNDPAEQNKVTLKTETFPTSTTEGNFSLYNNDYNIAFKIEATSGDAASEANLRALAGYHVSRVANVLGDINITNIVVANSTSVSGFNDAEALTSATNKSALAMATAQKGAATLWVKVSNTLNISGELEQIILTGVYYYSPNADGVYVANEGINFGSLTCGLYTTDKVGLKCYYRVNIYDSSLGITNMMYYSVVRNYSYHMTISKIKSIGYPTQTDLTVEPDEPLTNNTFVQAHVIINQWKYKTMNNVEIGM
jgi:hypothetical protein